MKNKVAADENLDIRTLSWQICVDQVTEKTRDGNGGDVRCGRN